MLGGHIAFHDRLLIQCVFFSHTRHNAKIFPLQMRRIAMRKPISRMQFTNKTESISLVERGAAIFPRCGRPYRRRGQRCQFWQGTAKQWFRWPNLNARCERASILAKNTEYQGHRSPPVLNFFTSKAHRYPMHNFLPHRNKKFSDMRNRLLLSESRNATIFKASTSHQL